MLSSEELKRYHRHIILPGFGIEGQEKLHDASVLVIGAGGLGCPVLQYLSAAGVGRIGIIDGDFVEESNLQRQILFDVADIGKNKAQCAAEILMLQNPFVECEVFQFMLDKGNALSIISKYDLVVDGCDNFETRYLVNDACIILNKPFVFGSIFKFEAQVSVFNYTNKEGKRGPTYRCLFPEPPQQGSVPNCSEVGVIGILPGLAGTTQANEAIKIIYGIGEPLSGRLLILDALTMNSQIINFAANVDNYNITQLSNYDFSCNIETSSFDSKENTIDALGLKNKLDLGENIFLLDVREPHEHQICKLSEHLIPMNLIPQYVDQIPTDIPVVVYCHHGIRSAKVIQYLNEKHGMENLYNLEGGIHAWARDVDEGMDTY